MIRQAYIRRETAVSVAINAVLSLLFFLLVFGRLNAVPVWGIGKWVFDFLPQSFMIALMSTLVPGALASRAVVAEKVAADGPVTRLPSRLVVRALLLAVASAALGTLLVAGFVALSGRAEIPHMTALVVKIAYGAVLSSIITPIGLRPVLARAHNTG